MADEEEPECCPLCMEELDLTDKTFNACPCGYQVRSQTVYSLDGGGRALRLIRSTPGVLMVLASDQERVQRALPRVPRALHGAVQAQEPTGPRRVRVPMGKKRRIALLTCRIGPLNLPISVMRRTKQRKQKEKHERRTAAQTKYPTVNRKNLANVRVMQRNLVYVIGLPQHFAEEEVGRLVECVCDAEGGRLVICGGYCGRFCGRARALGSTARSSRRS